jgi:hypothetical protein
LKHLVFKTLFENLAESLNLFFFVLISSISLPILLYVSLGEPFFQVRMVSYNIWRDYFEGKIGCLLFLEENEFSFSFWLIA